MDQRFYNSASTNRSFAVEMPSLGLRSYNDNIFREQQKELEKNLSRQSNQLSRSKKNLSKASLHHVSKYNSNKSAKNVNEVNQIVQNYGEGRIQDIDNDNISTNKFQFRILSYLGEVSLAYGITIGLMYLNQLNTFPFFLVLFMFGLMSSIMPWAKTNLIVIIGCTVIIANYFLSIQILTLPIILIFYFSVLIFNQHNKIKLLFIPVLVTTMVWGFVVIPALYSEFVKISNRKGFYYVFPLFMYILRVFLYLSYREIKYTEYIFLQLPFYLTGIEIGVMMTLNVDDIQFWYLMVFFTLQIINDRTQFSINILIALSKSLGAIAKRKDKKAKRKKSQSQSEQIIRTDEKRQSAYIEQDVTILASHASGYCSVNFLHLVGIVYVFTVLPLTSPPYTKTTLLKVYVQNKQYLPVVIWALGLVYELMCLILQRKRKDKLLIGFTNNGILHTIQRGFMLAVGFWLFYLGLGIGNYAVSRSA